MRVCTTLTTSPGARGGWGRGLCEDRGSPCCRVCLCASKRRRTALQSRDVCPCPAAAPGCVGLTFAFSCDCCLSACACRGGFYAPLALYLYTPLVQWFGGGPLPVYLLAPMVALGLGKALSVLSELYFVTSYAHSLLRE